MLAKNSKHFGKNRYIKLYEKFGIPENRHTFAIGNGNETETEKSSLKILIAKKRALIVTAF